MGNGAGSCDPTIGLEVADIAVHGCITKAPCGGKKAGKSPVDREKQASHAWRRWTGRIGFYEQLVTRYFE